MQQIRENDYQINQLEANNTSKEPNRLSKQIRKVIVWICVAFAVCYAAYFVTCKFFISTVEITGHSMQKTIFDGDKVVLNNQNYEPQQGDIVVIAENGTQLDTAIIKRVIAVAGQTVDIDFQTGAVLVDGEVLNESSYTENGSTTKKEGLEFPQTVPENCVFVLGDNRSVSEDSRNPKVGMVNKRFILGKVTMVVYPLRHIKFF